VSDCVERNRVRVKNFVPEKTFVPQFYRQQFVRVACIAANTMSAMHRLLHDITVLYSNQLAGS